APRHRLRRPDRARSPATAARGRREGRRRAWSSLPVMVQAEDPDRGGEALLSATPGVDFGCKLVQGNGSFRGDGAEGGPERGLQRDAGAVAAERERVFFGAGGHCGRIAGFPRKTQNP